MDKFIVKGGKKLTGTIKVSGAKNVAMKTPLLGLLTDKPIYASNIPLISSVYGSINIVRPLGVKAELGNNHTLTVYGDNIKSYKVPLELGGLYRTATMTIGPLLCRFGKAIVPNPGGCRLGKRPINRHIAGLKKMGAKVKYKDGYFIAEAKSLTGTKYRFSKNSHTGTETLILAAVLAEGETILENAACEPEVDDLIRILNLMGAKIRRKAQRTIIIQGVKKLNGAEFAILPDRNEVVTFAIAAVASQGDVLIDGTRREDLKAFLAKLDEVGLCWEPISGDETRFYQDGKWLKSTNVVTAPHPGFMTDWQAPWALLMTQAEGVSTIHETIYEDRFGYVSELKKMGAKIDFFKPHVSNPSQTYNFNWSDKIDDKCQAIKIKGSTKLHNAVLQVMDLRAGATLVLAATISEGESIIRGIEHIDRGYEKIEERLNSIGADIRRVTD